MDIQTKLFEWEKTSFNSLFCEKSVEYPDLPLNLIPQYFSIEIQEGHNTGIINVYFQPPKKECSGEDLIKQNNFFKINPGYSKEGSNLKNLLNLYIDLASHPQHVISYCDLTYILKEAKGKTLNQDNISNLLKYLDEQPFSVDVSIKNLVSSSEKNIGHILRKILLCIEIAKM